VTKSKTKFLSLATQLGSRSVLTRKQKEPMIPFKGFSRLESFVRRPIPHITTFVLLVHLALGCCMHHTHACETACCETPVAVAEACPCGGHEHDEDDSTAEHNSNDQDSNRPHEHSCDGAKCVFMQTETHTDVSSELNAGEFAFAILLESEELTASAAAIDHLLQIRYGFADPPLRTHLLNQILLI
jgi:hypothetical protein